MKRVPTILLSAALVGCGAAGTQTADQTGSVDEAFSVPRIVKCRATCDNGSHFRWRNCYSKMADAQSYGAKYCKGDPMSVTCSVVRQRRTCQNPTGGFWGDPHMTTFDGLHYEFQPIGEFVLATDNSTYTAQVRTGQYGNTSASIATAITFQVGSDVVQLNAVEKPALLVNGQPGVFQCDGQLIPNGNLCAGQINFDSGAYLTFDGGSSFSMNLADEVSHIDVQLQGFYLNTQVFAGPAIEGSMTGILGNINGNQADDFITRPGQVLNQPVAFTDMYNTYGNSWRVSEQESLFTYQNGKNTQNYTDPSFPGKPFTAADLPASDLAAARAACAAAGVPLAQLDACAMDGVVIGGSSVQDYLHIGEF